MSKTWDMKIAEIEERYNQEGFSNFSGWSVIQSVMLTGIEAINLQKVHLSYWPGNISEIGTVCEIGSGFGAMHYVWRTLGYSGPWFVYDYPIMIELHKYYSNLVGMPEPHQIGLLSPNVDMLIACFSLSEMDLDEREAVMKHAKFNHHLVAYASMWDDVDNREYFSSWPGKEIEFPDMAGIYYHVR